jgi:Kdo2-lipid IVA lauroyltransferase/acyltransferase
MLLIRLLAALPLPLLHALGTLLGWSAYAMSPTYRRHLRENLAQAGYLDAATRRAAVSAAGKAVLELPAIWLRPRADVLRWVKRIDGEALIDAARAQGRGLVFLTPHHGCFEITAKVAAERFPITALYRPPKLRFVQALIESGRAGPNLRLATPDYAGVRELLGALKRKEAVGVLPDQVPSEGEGAWVDFFGRPAYTMTLAGRLVQRPGSVTLLAFGERLPRGQGYVVHLRPLAAALPGESDARRVNRALEDMVRECPQQYLWGYNRYKHPRGAPAPPGAAA